MLRSTSGFVPTKDLEQEKKDQLRKLYEDYAATQIGFVAPKAQIAVEVDEESRQANVHMDAHFNDVNYHFEALKPSDAKSVFDYLYSQPVVMSKYANGKPRDWEATEKRVQHLAKRFKLGEDLEYLSGFIVTDADDDRFLGMVNLGAAGPVGKTEMARSNRADAWGAKPEIVKEYVIPNGGDLAKVYPGLGTVETAVMIQYAQHLKNTGVKIQGNELSTMTTTNRVDNIGAWKSNAKNGMTVDDLDINPAYGSDLRYQLSIKLK